MVLGLVLTVRMSRKTSTVWEERCSKWYIYLPIGFKWLCGNAEAVRNDSTVVLYVQMQWIRAATLVRLVKSDATFVKQLS